MQDTLHDATLAFQGTLGDDQRRELLRIGQDAIPDADDILIFTAQLDSINKNRKGRSFATHFHKFLSSIRDFCGIIDTYVSAHPEMAALVWGSVKLTMMIVANFASYSEAIANLFTTLGDLCPLFSEYRTLFYDSAGLRKSLDNFYASMVRCCSHIVMAMQRSWFAQFLKVLQASFDQEFKPDLEEIQRHARKVKRQIALAKAQEDKKAQKLQEKERVEASEGRAIMKRHITLTDCSLDSLRRSQIQNGREKSRKRAQKLLDSLSTYNYSRSLKQSIRKRHGDTTNWIHQTPQFQRWMEGGSSVVWCSGKIGCGKTIATASAIKRIQQPSTIPNTPLITYLFMQTDDRDSLNAEIVLRTLLRQLLDETMVSGVLGNILHNIVLSWDWSEITNLFLKLVPARRKAYIFIDGLDECNRESRQVLFETLSTIITDAGNIRLYLSSRDSVRDDVTKYFPSSEHISLDCVSTSDDIACYINDVIDVKLEKGDLKVGNDELVKEIKDSLANGAQGMYLWAYFQIEEICLQVCDEDIRQALKDLPRDLAEVFQRVLRRISVRRRGPVARKIFPWVAAARRPLLIGELREAIAIEIGQQNTEPSRLYNGMENVASWCENLIEVDEENGSVQFAHSAVRAFLVDSPSDSTLADFHFDLEAVDHYLGEICITYLDFTDFKTTLATRPRPLLIDPSQIATTALKPVSKSAALLSKLNSKRVGTHTIDLQMQHLKASSPGHFSATETLIDVHPFLNYASSYWVAHTRSFDQERSRTWPLWQSILDHGHVLARKPWNVSGGSSPVEGTTIGYRDPMVIWAGNNGHFAIIRLVVARNRLSLDDAVRSGNLNLFGLLLNEDKIRTQISEDSVNRAFQTAIFLHRWNMVVMMLAADVHLNINKRFRVSYGQCNALEVAAGARNLHLVNKLLASGADARESLGTVVEMGYSNLKSILDDWNVKTCRTGNGTSAMCIKSHELNGRAENPSYISALQDHVELAGKLIAATADLNGWGVHTHRTALHLAVGMGHLEMVEVLLSAGADIETQDDHGLTPLHIAAEMGHLNIIKVLISAEASDKAKDAMGKTPLHLAVELGQWDVVKVLMVYAGTDIDLKGSASNDILIRAVRVGQLDVVDLLLAAGADLNPPKTKGALWEAARYGQVDMVCRLLAAGADVNGNKVDCSHGCSTGTFEGGNGSPSFSYEGYGIVGTPIYAATIASNTNVMLKLLGAGAAENLTDAEFRVLISKAKEARLKEEGGDFGVQVDTTKHLLTNARSRAMDRWMQQSSTG